MEAVLPLAARPVHARLVVPARSYAHESLLLLHAPRLAMVLGFATMGTFLAPVVDPLRWLALLAALAFGVGLGAYRLDEMADHSTALAIPRRHHAVVAALGLAVAGAIGLWMGATYSWWLTLPAALAWLGVLGYNLVPRLHHPFVFALTWGALPVWGAYALQTLAMPPPHVFAAGALTGALGLAHLWTWGLRRCGRGPACGKVQNAMRGGTNGPCHSLSVRCATRLTMPDELNAHAKASLRLQYAMVAGLVAWVVMAHAGF